MSYEELTAAAAAVRERTGREAHSVAVVLGSGLGDYAATLPGGQSNARHASRQLHCGLHGILRRVDDL